MNKNIIDFVEAVDRVLAPLGILLARENGSLITFLLHGIFLDRQDMASELADPQQRMTLGTLQQLVIKFQDAGYQFIHPGDLEGSLSPQGRYAMLTLDDGYANNLNVVPLLEKLDAPATVFISTGNVSECRAYWWDVVYRKGRALGRSAREIVMDQTDLKNLQWNEINKEMVRRYGEDSLRPVSEVDRPMTVAELQDLARHSLIDIGNHTVDHVILSNCDDTECARQIQQAQEHLLDWLGASPFIISYPNGSYGRREVRLSQQAGLRLGISTIPRSTRLPLGAAKMDIGRFSPKVGSHWLENLDVFRSRFQVGVRLSLVGSSDAHLHHRASK